MAWRRRAISVVRQMPGPGEEKQWVHEDDDVRIDRGGGSRIGSLMVE